MSLPDGWIQQYDSNHKRHFWVDTKSNPPRAIWVHPYEDEEFLAEHPEVRAKRKSLTTSGVDAPPSYDAATKGRVLGSRSREKSGSFRHSDSPGAISAGPSSHPEHKRGVFGRLKDKAIGTKEEREEQKRIRAEQAARGEEQARQARQRQFEERREQKRIRAEQAAQAEEEARQARMRELEAREAYMRAHGGYAPYYPSYAAGSGYNPYGYGPAPAQGPGLGGPNTAALLLGGLAGGLLLGDIFGGGGFF